MGKRKEASFADKVGLFLSNYKRLHQAAVTHKDEGVGRTAIEIIAGSKMLSDWDKGHYFGDTAIFTPHLSVAENAWERIEGGVIPQSEKLDKAKMIASFSAHEPVAIDAVDYIEKSDIDERDKLSHAQYIGTHTKYLSVAKRTLSLISRSQLKKEEKIRYIQEIASRSKHNSIRKKASEWLEGCRIVKA